MPRPPMSEMDIEERITRLQAAAQERQRRLLADPLAANPGPTRDELAGRWMKAHRAEIDIERELVADGNTCAFCDGSRWIDLPVVGHHTTSVMACPVELAGHYGQAVTQPTTPAVEAVQLEAAITTLAAAFLPAPVAVEAPASSTSSNAGSVVDHPPAAVPPSTEQVEHAEDTLLHVAVLAAVKELPNPTTPAITQHLGRRKQAVGQAVAAAVAAGHLAKPGRGRPLVLTGAGREYLAAAR